MPDAARICAASVLMYNANKSSPRHDYLKFLGQPTVQSRQCANAGSRSRVTRQQGRRAPNKRDAHHSKSGTLSHDPQHEAEPKLSRLFSFYCYSYPVQCCLSCYRHGGASQLLQACMTHQFSPSQSRTMLYAPDGTQVPLLADFLMGEAKQRLCRIYSPILLLRLARRRPLLYRSCCSLPCLSSRSYSSGGANVHPPILFPLVQGQFLF